MSDTDTSAELNDLFVWEENTQTHVQDLRNGRAAFCHLKSSWGGNHLLMPKCGISLSFGLQAGLRRDAIPYIIGATSVSANVRQYYSIIRTRCKFKGFEINSAFIASWLQHRSIHFHVRHLFINREHKFLPLLWFVS